MLATYIFCAICVAGAAFFCWCFAELHGESKGKPGTHRVGVYEDASAIAFGHHCIVSIRDGLRIPAAPAISAVRWNGTAGMTPSRRDEHMREHSRRDRAHAR